MLTLELVREGVGKKKSRPIGGVDKQHCQQGNVKDNIDPLVRASGTVLVAPLVRRSLSIRSGVICIRMFCVITKYKSHC